MAVQPLRQASHRILVLLAVLATLTVAGLAAQAGPASAACPPGNSDPNYCTGGPTAVINVPRDGGRYSTTVAPFTDFYCQRGSNPLLGLPPATLTSNSGSSCTSTLPFGQPLYSASAASPHATVGGQTFTVTATDSTNATSAATSTYSIMPFSSIITGDNPSVYFRLNDADGAQILDNQGSGPDGEYKNKQQSYPVGISGDGDTARRFFGDSGYGYVNGISAPRNGWTMEAWVYLPDTDSPANPNVVNDGTIMEHGSGGSLYIKNGIFTARNGNDVVQAIGTQPDVQPVDNTWYHVVARWDGGDLAIFVNRSPGVGVAKTFYAGSRGSTPSTYYPGGSATFYVGFGNQGGVGWLNGVLDEVGYFPSSLSTAQISDHYYADPVPSPKTFRNGANAPGFTADSSNPAANTPTARVSVALRKAKARVAGLTSQLKRAALRLQALKKAHANRKVLKLGKAEVTRLEKAIKVETGKVRSLAKSLARARAQQKAIERREAAARARKKAAAKKHAAAKRPAPKKKH